MLPKEQYEFIKNFMESDEISWHYNKGISHLSEKDDLRFYYFTHLFLINNVQSPFFGFLKPILDILKPQTLIRIKGNFYPSSEKIVQHNKHKDYEFKHLAAVYYINDNDGYTLFEDGTKIESIGNRLVYFDGSVPHCSTNCTTQHGRININFNYI